MQQVLVNLVINAMDAMTGTVPARRRLTIRAEHRDADVEISVRDNGTGVPPDIIETLFTPFMTTKAYGLGIGLTIVRTILDAHGGIIAARNNPEGGATFVVTLPRIEEICRIAGRVRYGWRLVLPTRPRVLLADDYPDMVKAVSRLLAHGLRRRGIGR